MTAMRYAKKSITPETGTDVYSNAGWHAGAPTASAWTNSPLSSLAGARSSVGPTLKPKADSGLPDPSPNPVQPDFDADNFPSGQPITSPYFPFHVGTIYTYGNLPDEEDPEADIERNDMFYSYETKQILGVETFVMRDTAYVNGVMAEDTLDYFAQDEDGNVWYFGELSYSFHYDDDGNYLNTSTSGSWIADGVNNFPGYIMPAPETLVGLTHGYLQEVAPGVALDQADVLSFNASVELELGPIRGALSTLESTALEPTAREIKTYEPGVGLVLVEEFDEFGEVELTTELLGVRAVGGDIPPDPHLFRDRNDLDLKHFVSNSPTGVQPLDQPELEDFTEFSSNVHVTYLGGLTEANNALGAYTFNISTGIITDVRILFSAQSEQQLGDEFTINLDGGEGFGLFLVPDGGELGLDLDAFGPGDLSMVNFLSLGAANVNDGLAPLITADGDVLPIPAFHALDLNTVDTFNLLNLDGAVHVREMQVPDSTFAPGEEETGVLAFEDMFATDPEFDGDFDDLVVAVSQVTLSNATVAALAEDLNLAASGGAAV